MKKTTLICVGIALISLSSCKKDYICSCVKKDTATGATLPTSSSTSKTTKKHAAETCKSDGSSFGVPVGETWTCTLE